MKMRLGAVCALVLSACAWAGEVKTDPVPVVKTTPALAPLVDWPAVFRNLQSIDNVVQETAAVDFLKGMVEPAAATKKPYVTELVRTMIGADAKLKAEAVKRIATVGLVLQKNKQFPVMLQSLTGAEEKARSEQLAVVFKTLEDLLQSDHVHDLIDKLGSDDVTVSTKAAEELKALGGEAADDLATALDDDKVQVKKTAAQLLRDMGPAAKEAVNTLIFKIQDADDKLGRKLAVQVLEGLGPNAAEVAEDLVLKLDDDDKVVRKVSYDILKKMGPAYKETATDLVNYLSHDDKSVRVAATELLMALGAEAKSGVRDLADVVDDAPPPNTPQVPGAQVIGNDSDSKVRAANILAMLGPDAKEAGPSLKKYENDKDPLVAQAVKDALVKIGPYPEPVENPVTPVAQAQPVPKVLTPFNPNAPVKPPKPPENGVPPRPSQGDNF